MFSYRSILKQAWNITWQYKYLCIFGLFATVAAASGSSEYQFIVTSLQSGVVEGSYYHLGVLLVILKTIGLFLMGITKVFSYNIVIILNAITVLAIVTALISAFIWLAITSQAALVSSSKKIITAKKKLGRLSLRALLTEGHQHFWRVLSLNVLAVLVISLLLSIMSVPLVIMAERGSEYLAIIYTIGFMVLVPMAVTCSFILKYAIAFQVLDNTGFYASLKKSWELFTKNWLVSLEMGLLLFIISFLSSFVLLLILFFFIYPYFVFALAYGITWLIIFLTTLALVITLAFGAFLTTFQISSWTGLFLELKRSRGESKIERIFKKRK